MKLFNRDKKTEMRPQPELLKFEKKLTAEQQTVQDDIVRVLERYLERAKAGYYIGVVVACARHDKNADTCSSATLDFSAQLGAAQFAVHRLCMNADIRDEPFPED